MVITWLKTHCIFLNSFPPSRNNKQQNNYEIVRLECKFVNGVNRSVMEKQLDYSNHIRNIEKLVTKLRKKTVLYQVG